MLFDPARQIPDAIDLSIGQTDFDVPDPIKEATICAIQSGGGGYGPTQGDPELVEATKSYLQARPEPSSGASRVSAKRRRGVLLVDPAYAVASRGGLSVRG